MNSVPDVTGGKQAAKRVGNRFKKGQSGNPKGRPIGARSQLSEDLLSAMKRDFAEHGKAVIEEARKTDPLGYWKTMVSVIPKEFDMRLQVSIADEFERFIRELSERSQ